MSKAKSFDISKWVVWDAFQTVKANQGAPGVDGQTLENFETDLKGNLYKIWNRMSSGTYFPSPVRLVEIEKSDGNKRPLGIPTVADRVAQTVAKRYLEPELEPVFHPDSFGYRPGKSALGAVGLCRERCWRSDWVIDLDIKGFFDNLNHELVMKAVRYHTDLKWLHLYIQRWLEAPAKGADGEVGKRVKGTPQGGVISPLVANLYMHYAFDQWMNREYPQVPFERYADDAIIHCESEAQAQRLLEDVRERLMECNLELHPEKTKIVYCKDDNRPGGEGGNTSFDFLGYQFRSRRARNRKGTYFISFSPAISPKAAKGIRQIVRDWEVPRTKSNQTLETLARLINPRVQGWLNYYGRYNRSECVRVLSHINRVLTRWVMRKCKRYRRKMLAATHWLGRVARRSPRLMVLWQRGARPATGK